MKSIPIILAILVILLSPGVSAYEADDAKSGHSGPPALSSWAGRIVGEAQGLVEEENFEQAIQKIEASLQKHPDRDHHLIEFTLANALALSGRKRKAMAHYRTSVDLYPGYAPSWLNLGKTTYDLEEYELAGEAFLEGYKTSEEKNPQNLYYAAVAYVMAKRVDEALPHLERLVSGELGEPRAEWIKALLMIYMEKDLAVKAKAMLSRLVEIQGNDPVTWKLMCQFAVDQADYTKVATAMTIYSYLKPLDRDEMILLGDLYLAAGIPLQGAIYYRKALSGGGKPQEYEQLASAYIAAHRPKKAIGALRKALEVAPSSKLWSLLGEALYSEEEFEDAYNAFDRSAALDQKDGRAYIMMAYCAIAMKQESKAAQVLQAALRFPKQRKRAEELMRFVNPSQSTGSAGEN